MAQPANTYDSYDQIGIREDLSDAIYNLSPTETPLLSALKKTRARNYYHEWQTDTIRSSENNATIEGDDLVARALNPTVRLGNYVQTLSDAITISTGDENLNKAGRSREMGYQIEKAVKGLKLDAERALYLNNARVAGNSTTPREFAGTQTWMTQNTNGGTGSSDPSGDGTDTRTTGTNRALTQTIFDNTMQSIWDNSGSKKRMAVLSSNLMNVALGFVGNNNQRGNVDASAARVYNAIDMYVTPWGEVDFVMSRETDTSTVHLIDPDMWCIAEKIGMRNFEMAKTGLSDKRGFEWEWTLVCKNEASSGLIADLSAA